MEGNEDAPSFLPDVPQKTPGTMRMRFVKRKPIGATWLGRPFLNKVNGGRFSIHQQEAAPFEIFHCVTASSRSKLALVRRHQTVQAVSILRLLPSARCTGRHCLAYS